MNTILRPFCRFSPRTLEHPHVSSPVRALHAPPSFQHAVRLKAAFTRQDRRRHDAGGEGGTSFEKGFSSFPPDPLSTFLKLFFWLPDLAPQPPRSGLALMSQKAFAHRRTAFARPAALPGNGFGKGNGGTGEGGQPFCLKRFPPSPVTLSLFRSAACGQTRSALSCRSTDGRALPAGHQVTCISHGGALLPPFMELTS